LALATTSGRAAATKFVVSNYATAHAAGRAPFEVGGMLKAELRWDR